MTRDDAQREVDRLIHHPSLIMGRLSAGRYFEQRHIDPPMRAVLKALFDARDDLRKLGNAAAAEMVCNAIQRVAFSPSDSHAC
jgi:hypothetical protein